MDERSRAPQRPLTSAPPPPPQHRNEELHRSIDWKGAFWVASGVPALVLFSIGSIATTVGAPSWLIWTVSIVLGFLQSFVYAEISGLYPNKSGGASVYGAMAWLPYSKLVAPVSVWCNWLAWSPVLTIGSGLASGYILTALAPAGSPLHTWQLTLVDLGSLQSGLALRINAQFLLAVVLLLVVFAVQHHGILRAARVTTIIGVAVLVPLFVVGIVPLFNGHVTSAHFHPFAPLHSSWSHLHGWTLVAGGLFMAAWSTYAFETTVCYTREFKSPGTDTFRAIFSSGLLCLLLFILVPLTFQGALGVAGITDPAIVDGTGVGRAMATMVGGGATIRGLLVVMLTLALLLSIITSMAGSSRTLYQGSADGWLPRYLGHVNRHGAPTRAMWTDLCFNVALLTMSNYVFVLAASNVCYIIFNFLNLNAGWIHRMDRPNTARPWRAPTLVLGIGGLLAFVNIFIMGWGADVWGGGTVAVGLIAAALIVPVFLFRHYVRDRGVFPHPPYSEDDDGSGSEGTGVRKRAGILPYLALLAGLLLIILGQFLSRTAG